MSSPRLFERRSADERLLEQAVEKGGAAGNHQRDEQGVAAGELLELPLVGDPVLPTAAPRCLLIESTWTLPTSRWDSTTIMPLTAKNEARVTMKLGSPVLLTMKPLNQPIAAAMRNAAPMAHPMLMPVAHEGPRHQPDGHRAGAGHDARRQIELATDHQQGDGRGHDAVGRGDVEPVQRRVRLDRTCRALPQKKIHTMTAPMSAPISGEISHRCIGPRWRSARRRARGDRPPAAAFVPLSLSWTPLFRELATSRQVTIRTGMTTSSPAGSDGGDRRRSTRHRRIDHGCPCHQSLTARRRWTCRRSQGRC